MDSYIEERARLLGSLLLFIQVFYKIRTGREFEISQPIGRESHHITICRELTRLFYIQTNRLIVNIPPGYGKSEMCIGFVAWALAHYPDSNFIYVSYSHDLAAKHTYTIKQIIDLPAYRKLFGVEIRRDSSAKDDFKTTQGGCIKAFGSSGTITGQDAGLPNLDRFSGCIIMDDMHKPDEVHSDTIRNKVKRNYSETILQRPRGPNVALLGIGQRLHEDDLFGNLINKYDGYEWEKIILKCIDDQGNVLNPKLHDKKALEIKKEYDPYVYSSQFQQEPQPSGGSIFKQEWFVLLNEEPEFLATFVTSDSAETDKDYNDATVFSFWGIYKIKEFGEDIDLLGLHLIDCVELRVEPKDLESEFNQFYVDCMRHKVKPVYASIEKKSTGVTLSSVLKNKRGINIIEIERTKSSGSKVSRFLEIQPFIAQKRISLLSSGKLWFLKENKLVNLFIHHMIRITANDSHRFDDIADTCYDAIKLGLIDKSIYSNNKNSDEQTKIVTELANKINTINRVMGARYG